MNRHVLVSLCASCCFFACSSADSAAERSPPQVNQFRAALLPDGGPDCVAPVVIERELMIRDPIVLEDPVRSRWLGGPAPSDGAWAFGKLMTSMAGPNNPSAFVRNWLAQWETPQIVNGFAVQQRSQMQALVTNPWLAASGGVNLDLTRAPFRLLAIVNRMDLGDLANGSAGEGRFVFGVLDSAGNPLQFTVILEYRLPATTQADVNRWVTDWHGLAALPLGSPAFNTALEAITNRFAGANAAPGRVNGSSIGQVRTNEIALAAPWELREFTLDAVGQLRETPVAQTADFSFNNSPVLASFINANEAALLAGTHVVPLTFNGAPMRAGSALTPPGFFWFSPAVTNNEARFMFSVNTCNGCHAGETGTAFLHVAPRPLGQASLLSGFLTGRTVPDPVTQLPRTFKDLDRRATAFGAQICAAAPPVGTTITVTSPANGATVSGLVTLAASVTGPFSRVEFSVDGLLVGPPLFAAPFSAVWDSRTAPIGSHAIKATAFDAANVPTVSPPLTVNTAPTSAPDFTITAVTGPSVVSPGAPFTAQVTVCNQGNVSGGTNVDAVLSADAIIDPAFPLSPVGDRLFPGPFTFLNAGQCSTVNVNGNATPPGPNGSYFFGAVADLPNSTIELNETNNRRTGAQVIIGSGPDLLITEVKGPVSALPGSSFTATVTVCNQGNQSASAPVDVVLSTDTNISISGGDARVGGGSVFLGPGQCQTLNFPANASPNGPGNLWFLGAIVDFPNFAIELNEGNNTRAGAQIGIGFFPDFVITDVKGPESATPGSPFNALVTVCNQGTTAGNTNVDLVLSADNVINVVLPILPGADRPVGGTNVPLNPGQCVVQLIQGFANPPGGNGLWFLGAIADLPNQKPELNEANNTSSGKQLAIGFGPDFVITDVKGPTSALPGSSFIAQVTVCNVGTMSGFTNVDLVLSTDAVISVPTGSSPPGADRLVGGTSLQLFAGQCVTQNVSGSALPPGPNGAYFLGAIADFPNASFELNETNNTNSGRQVGIGSGPDFVISTVIAPASAPMGSSFLATVTACNQGNMPSSTSIDLVLSVDSTLAISGTSGPNSDRLAGHTDVFLAPAQCSTFTVNGFASVPGPAGSYFVGAIADVNSSVFELNETNNASAAAPITFF